MHYHTTNICNSIDIPISLIQPPKWTWFLSFWSSSFLKFLSPPPNCELKTLLRWYHLDLQFFLHLLNSFCFMHSCGVISIRHTWKILITYSCQLCSGQIVKKEMTNIKNIKICWCILIYLLWNYSYLYQERSNISISKIKIHTNCVKIELYLSTQIKTIFYTIYW